MNPIQVKCMKFDHKRYEKISKLGSGEYNYKSNILIDMGYVIKFSYQTIIFHTIITVFVLIHTIIPSHVR